MVCPLTTERVTTERVTTERVTTERVITERITTERVTTDCSAFMRHPPCRTTSPTYASGFGGGAPASLRTEGEECWGRLVRRDSA